MSNVTALVADDEPLLLAAMVKALEQAWPGLQIVTTATNGLDAISEAFKHAPDIVFLDIQMPGATGIEVAQTLVEDWPEQTPQSQPPLIVFATAFDDYAIQAFDASAVDYLLKPVKHNRLAQTVDRLKSQLADTTDNNADQLTAQLQQMLHFERQRHPKTEMHLRVIRASVGETVRVIPVEDVILFESADKYVSVHTAEGEALIREPLKKLLPQLDPERFEQIHRGAIVNMTKVDSAVRSESGAMTLTLRGLQKTPAVSRLYRHLFQPM